VRDGDFLKNQQEIKRVGVFGHYGNENLGDETIVAATIQNIKRFLPEAEIYGFSINPDDTQKKHGVQSFPIRSFMMRKKEATAQAQGDQVSALSGSARTSLAWQLRTGIKKVPVLFPLIRAGVNFFRGINSAINELELMVRSYHILRKIDLLLIAGSGQLNDENGGVAGFPLTLFKWNMMAKLAGSRVAFVSVGAGPLDSPFSRRMVKFTIHKADYISFRDQGSKDLISEIDPGTDRPVYPDLAFSHQFYSVPARHGFPAARPIVGINPLPFYDERYWPVSDKRVYEEYLEKIARMCLWLIDTEHTVSFISLQLKVSPAVIRDVIENIHRLRPNFTKEYIIHHTITGLEDLFAELSACDYVIATRFHGILLSLSLCKPVIGLCYSEKSVQLMQDMDQGEYSLDIASFTLEEVQTKFASLKINAPTIATALKRHVDENKRKLDEQYLAILNRNQSPQPTPHPVV